MLGWRNGIRARLRCVCRKACWFKSSPEHHLSYGSSHPKSEFKSHQNFWKNSNRRFGGFFLLFFNFYFFAEVVSAIFLSHSPFWTVDLRTMCSPQDRSGKFRAYQSLFYGVQSGLAVVVQISDPSNPLGDMKFSKISKFCLNLYAELRPRS